MCNPLQLLHNTHILHYTTHTIVHYTALHYTTLHPTTRHNTILYYTTLHNTTLHYTILYYTILYYTVLHNTLHYTTLHKTHTQHNTTCTTQHTTPHYTTLHYTNTTLHYTTQHTQHYTSTLHYTTHTTLHYSTQHTTQHNTTLHSKSHPSATLLALPHKFCSILEHKSSVSVVLRVCVTSWPYSGAEIVQWVWWLGYGLDVLGIVVRFPAEANIKTGYGTFRASYSMDIWSSFLWGKTAGMISWPLTSI